MERKPAVAGSFYPSDPKRLKRMIGQLLSSAETESTPIKRVVSCVAPHAGYIYSGAVAAHAYNAIKLMRDLKEIDTFMVIGPNHTGLGFPVSVSNADAWATPLGRVVNDREFVRVLAESGDIAVDEQAHRHEHSAEVQLPFIQSIMEKPRCVFVCMGDQSYKSAEGLERSISMAAGKLGRRIIVIASSDFNHYESGDTARRKDMPAIRALERLDPHGFYDAIEGSHDSACGYGPMAVSVMFARRRKASKGTLLSYANSGGITMDYDSVVSYASLAFV